MLKQISTDLAPAAIGPYSQAIEIDGILYTSGQIPIDASTGKFAGETIEVQTEQVILNLKAILNHAGASFESVIKTTCFLTDMDNFAVFNRIYEKYFTTKPARSCVAVKALPKGALVEVEVIASTRVK